MPNATGAPPATRAVSVILVPLMLVLFISNLDQTIVATALPSIARELGSISQAPWIATSYLLTSAVTTLIFGKLGDMFGRKRIFQISVAIFLVGSVLSGLSQNLVMLILFRGLQGIGGGGLNSLVQAIIGDVVPSRQRSKYQSAFGIVATVALIGGPFLGGFFSDALSWRWIFYINIPIGLVAFILIGIRLHLPTPASKAPIDVAGALVVTVFTSAALLFATLGGSAAHPWGSALIVGLIVVAVVALVGYLLIERRAKAPITPLGLFRSSVFTISAVQFFLATMVLFVGMIYTPLFLQTVRGLSAFEAGLFDIPLLLGLIVATAVAGPRIASTGGYKIYPIIGSILVGAGMTALGLTGLHTPVGLLVIPLFIAGGGVGFFVQVSLLAGQNAAPQSLLGVATGSLNFFKSIGGAFGAALFGSILAAAIGNGQYSAARSTHGFDVVFLATVPLEIVALILAIVMKEIPLSEEMVEVAAGKVEVQEY